ncbi:MAG: nucleotide exchange factor GrpE [Myxococcota bacterium]
MAHDPQDNSTNASTSPESTAADTPTADATEAAAEPTVELDPSTQRIEHLEAQLAETTARLRSVSKAFTQMKEEMASFQQRQTAQAKIKEEAQAFRAVQAFFDPVQSLGRSLESDASSEGFLEGLTLVHKQFSDALDSLGLAPIPGVGSPFNPSLHEALAVQPVTEPELDGKVVMVHVNGFSVNGKVLKASQVIIGKYDPPAAEA